MIPLAIVIGIIEDKIANDLTGNKSTKEHLEELKEKFEKHKENQKFAVEVFFKDQKPQAKIKHYEVDRVEITDKLFIIYENENIYRINIDSIEYIIQQTREEYDRQQENFINFLRGGKNEQNKS